MLKATKTRECALCGKRGPLTREHVPPRNLFLKPRPQNTITVPLCSTCNGSYHLDDEYFRVYITAGANPGTPMARLWKEKVVGSSFKRSGGLRGKLQDEYNLVRGHAEMHPLRFTDGEKVPKYLLPLVQPFDATRVEGVVEKIVRCLHYHHRGARLSGTVEVESTVLSEEQVRRTFEERTGEVGHQNEFVYRVQGTSSNQEVWTLIFYEHKAFRIRVRLAV